ncbi:MULTISPECIES: bifunctional 3-phenylpropionate/cinnamic acid dioxygenase ferredoxin subunit [Streptomyces]|uniref:Bifunctional 3-phenylpropionate/cinnamic acid dioxygenase ferredoxin subunit n=1 Tax=Streptomyces caniscabiei TaxID=2746961 RepID=A0ABU4N0Y6_9ACTN|nr:MULTISPECIES: bifunctional 3-phenylpropionate/cinnamic acid dioxygenase ferredoxin subunit [Streptomyces]MBE4737298.1 bifunctional 3-phenylpropionate/cinnamic acid dioxygenase ferredoxin subunit [Streptomyces caniscabiei]MBE4756058.1 bifunctional 3-phenylpropionate/cinnamic acid dioxygenase ferredoxin subunit [Streptomyces caniscabiei]MBE4769924.1 bifunctional 3-phenylpropionate/cinnamic acid dioxygenase ferredoxin subunit [Streptomyces caniscabiei]MBE4787129.1 bifunctional 3-phenylpropionat
MSTHTSGTAVRVATVGDIEDGEALRVPADTSGHGEAIAVFHDGGAYYALDDTCSHGQASLSEGWIEDGEVECPLHSARFCLTSGEPQCMPATVAVRTHHVEVRDDGIWLHPGRPHERTGE